MNGEARQELIKARLEHLASSGRLTPAAVVEDAMNEESPLHSYFEWDDNEAARKYRLTQARRLIRSVEVVIVSDKRIMSTVAYVRDPDAGQKEAGYTPTISLMDDRERARAAILNEVSRAAAYLGRVRSLASALDLEGEAAEIENRFAEFRQRVEVTA